MLFDKWDSAMLDSLNHRVLQSLKSELNRLFAFVNSDARRFRRVGVMPSILLFRIKHADISERVRNWRELGEIAEGAHEAV